MLGGQKSSVKRKAVTGESLMCRGADSAAAHSSECPEQAVVMLIQHQ